MCDYFWRTMHQNSQGDLSDIFGSRGLSAADTWHLLPEPSAAFAPPSHIFGDPFAEIGDPLLGESAAQNALPNASQNAEAKTNGSRVQKMLLEEEGKASIFSRMLQISPAEIGSSQIASTRVQGMKRRKSQVKKVVCIPAPAAASGRPSGTGEVVPSDLWAWRKYGQKPIKGSPYPRGYYRCSSSKGCSARKQVERSRTDPNMLVITYTSEHNHPWPTQRNALAGSTRSQPSKGSSTASSSSKHQSSSIKEEHKECSISTVRLVKEEAEAYEMEKALADPQDSDFDHVFNESFMMSDSSQPDNFFADLAELESSDPISLRGLDPFHMFNWEGGSSAEEANRGL